MNQLASRCLLVVVIVFTSCYSLAQQQENINGVDSKGRFFPVEWNTVMVESTYRIKGPSRTEIGKDTIGTAFILGVPIGDSKDGTQPSRAVLITARHILDGIGTDTATLDMRVFSGANWSETPVKIKIRNKGVPVWVSHPVADVAILDIQDPRIQSHLIEPLVPTDWLVTDSLLKDYQIHPGDEVTCLGFPEDISSQFGFPILRTAKIASFPILPTLTSRPLMLDFPVYGGNSGGPAYLVGESGRGNTLGTTLGHIYIIGLVVQKTYGAPEAEKAVAAQEEKIGVQKLEDMHLAILEPASVIIETIELLPGVSNGHFLAAPTTK